MRFRRIGFFISFFFSMSLLLCACDRHGWNNPHLSEAPSKIVRYASFSERPQTLDPARSYTVTQSNFISQIYEPPLQYHYLLRPYTLVPLTAKQMPIVVYLDKNKNKLDKQAGKNKIAFSRYEIEIKPGIYYEPHPAFSKNDRGEFIYHNLTIFEISKLNQPSDLKKSGRRELVADDYIYQIKRLAHPEVNSPVFGLMSKYIVGLDQYAKTLKKHYKNTYLDLRKFSLEGVQKLGRYKYAITIKGQYPQFRYWLAMNFFAPVPWEVDYFYSQPGMKENNISLDWFPVGTGPYRLTENNPNRRMTLERNPNFRGEPYPVQGVPGDKEKGFLKDAGKVTPFIDKVVFNLEKESMPLWNKFLQGYYDVSSIVSDSFDQAIQIDEKGRSDLTPEMKEKGIYLRTDVGPNIFFLGFNMLDPVVGGNSERAKKIRQAISIAINYQEFISIFLNGRGVIAQGPIPPGIFGFVKGKPGINPVVYEWKDNAVLRRSIDEAKKLLREAGYPNGRDIKTGKPLVLNYDVPTSSAPDDAARFNWMRKQIDKLGIQLHIRGTQANRFQQKIRTGQAQLFFWGWLADYPDPENFFFLLYGPNGKVKYGGENTSNYVNAKFDKLFIKMRVTPNGPERQKIINKMLEIVRNDAPWVFGFHTKDYILSHQWNAARKSHAVAQNTLKYLRIDPKRRAELQKKWNRATVWPVILIFMLLVVVIVPAVFAYRRHLRKSVK